MNTPTPQEIETAKEIILKEVHNGLFDALDMQEAIAQALANARPVKPDRGTILQVLSEYFRGSGDVRVKNIQEATDAILKLFNF